MAPHRIRSAALTLLLLWAGASGAVDLNTANQAELEQVKGVGPQLSGRLLEERANGPFRDWADVIRRMKGVGPASATKLSAGGLTVGGLAYVAPSAAPSVAPVTTIVHTPTPMPTTLPASQPAAGTLPTTR